MAGIVSGRSLWARMRSAFQGGLAMAGQHNPPLNAYLERIVKAVRRTYQRPLIYASLPFEQVNWAPFDISGVDHYRATAINETSGGSRQTRCHYGVWLLHSPGCRTCRRTSIQHRGYQNVHHAWAPVNRALGVAPPQRGFRTRRSTISK